MTSVSFKINLSQETLDTLDMQLIKKSVHKLINFFGETIHMFIPSEINSLSVLNSLISLSESLEKIKHCKGFDQHIIEYTNNRTSTSFVTFIANLILPNVKELEFEPDISSQTRKPDIKFLFEETEFYLECKCPFSNEKFNFYSEHKAIEEKIRERVQVPHQIDVNYNEPLTTLEIDRIVETLINKLPYVTASGLIEKNKKYSINISFQELPINNGLQFEFLMKSRSIDHLGNYKPEDSFFKNGNTISITGPNVNYEDVLLKLIKKSTGQAVKEKPFILAISMNNMVGNWANNIQAIQSSFQPNKNTRFTGVLFIEYFESTDFIFDYIPKNIFIQNPFSTVPHNSTLSYLFKNSN